MRSGRSAVAFAAVAVLVIATACASTDVDGSEAPIPPMDDRPASVAVEDNAFNAPALTVKVGDTITWTQTGTNPHSVTADDGSFDSHPSCPGTCMAAGDTFAQTFTEAGEFRYYCRVHGGPGGAGMAGVVTVTA